MAFIQTLWEYLLFSAPYLLFGLFIAGVVRSFLSVDVIKDKLGARSAKTVLLASAAGVPLPLCSCSVIPAAVTLKKSGASHGATSSFLISTPESGIDSIAVTYSLMDLPMTVIRPLVAFVSAMIAGLLQNVFNDFEMLEEQTHDKNCCSHTDKKKLPTTLSEKMRAGIIYSFTDLINDIAFWLTIGLLLGAGIEFFIPEGFLESLSGWTGRFVVLAIGLPLYICASASTPIAASMVLKGMSPGSALIFLLVGPATNFSNMAVLQKYIGKKGVVINVFAIAVVALLASYLTDMFYVDKIVSWRLEHHQHQAGAWWEIMSAVILSFLLVRGIYVDKLRRLL